MNFAGTGGAASRSPYSGPSSAGTQAGTPTSRGFTLRGVPSIQQTKSTDLRAPPRQVVTVEVPSRPRDMPLINVDVKVVVTTERAILTLTQTFQNDYDIPANVEYVFPILAKACITEFLALTGDTQYQGVVGEKEKVRARTKDLMENGISFATAEVMEGMHDLVKLSIGALAPHQLIKIMLRFALPLDVISSKTFGLIIPMVILHRYLPPKEISSESGRSTNSAKPSLLATPPIAAGTKFTLGTPYTMSFSLKVIKEMGEGKIHFEITSFNLEDFDVNEDPASLTLSLKKDRLFWPNQDIEIIFRRESSLAAVQSGQTSVFGARVIARTLTGTSSGHIRSLLSGQEAGSSQEGIGRCALSTFMIPPISKVRF